MIHMQRQRKTRSRWYGGSRRGWPLVKYGMIWFGIGVLITIGTYAFAVSRGGGTYLVSYGPMVVGAVCMVRGAIDMARERRAAGSVARPADAQAFAASPGQAFTTSPGQGVGTSPGQAFAQAPGQAFSQSPGYGTQAEAMAGGGMPAYGAYRNGPRQSSHGEPRQGRPGYGPDAPASAVTPQPNWYPDPGNPAMLRWWDGQMWTNHTRPYS